jgi:RNA polymerase sigma-70 factor, ECF subfamily
VVKTPTDEQLLSDHLQGRSDAFEQLVRRHSQSLYRFVLRFTNSSAAADDVTQEAFIQAFESAGKFDLRRRFRPWLFTIAANKARDWLRTRNRRSELPLDASLEGGDQNQTFAALLSSDADPPLEEPGLDEQRRAVRQVIEQLPYKMREVLILAYYHKLPYKEIAEILEVPLGTMKSRLHSAVGRFARAYHAHLEAVQNDSAER